MKKTLLTLLPTLTISGLIIAQPTITATDLTPTIGASFVTNNCDYQAPSASGGANQTWDYSNLVATSTITYNAIAANTTNFPSANIALDNGNSSVHYNYSPAGQEMVGLIAGTNVFNYVDGEMILHFPLVYNAVNSDSFRAVFNSGLPSTRTGTNVVTVDAYGTLSLPGNNALNNVMRVHLEQDYIDSLDLGGTYIEIVYASSVYLWYRAGYQYPILSFSSLQIGANTNESGYFTNQQGLSVESIEGVNSVQTLGNPFNHTLNFVIHATQNKNITYQIMDVLGNVVLSEGNTTIANGANQLSINTNHLSNGMYCLRVSDGKSNINTLVIKN